MIYQCRRSATVISSNYNTFAQMQFNSYKELAAEYPEYEQCLKKHIMTRYKDKKMHFLKKALRKVSYLRNASHDVIYNLIFSMTQQNFEKDQIILAERQLSDSLLLIEEGEVEIFTNLENNEFVIERLDKGSIINHKTCFIQEYMYVNIRATKDTKVLSLS